MARRHPHHTPLPNPTRTRAVSLIRRLVPLLVVLAALCVWFVNAGTLLIDAEPPVSADVIVVLAGNAPNRLPWAEELHRQGFSDLLIVSDEPVHTHGLETTWLALHRAGLSAPEIPDAALEVIDPPAESTIEEANRSAELMVAHGLKSALLVTESFHSRRAALLFRAAFAHRGLTVRPIPVADSLDLGHWWQHPLSGRRVVEEWAKLAYYLVQGAYF